MDTKVDRFRVRMKTWVGCDWCLIEFACGAVAGVLERGCRVCGSEFGGWRRHS